ncbi:uncharacterized protein LOC125948046 [Anopheles darlingi]|uniref:uncharacterized protein LOC125948046 n=1 Tax=Anopheles darlingi TaxID=43151 RepID=UPI00210045B4|nr:uncharacterized protein LOC125948046 [Anopheles darlingi]
MAHTTGLTGAAAVVVLILCANGVESGFISASTYEKSETPSQQGQGNIYLNEVQIKQHGSFGKTRVERAINEMEEPLPTVSIEVGLENVPEFSIERKWNDMN